VNGETCGGGCWWTRKDVNLSMKTYLLPKTCLLPKLKLIALNAPYNNGVMMWSAFGGHGLMIGVYRRPSDGKTTSI